jgi:tRNA pseudouridine(38-40) synthase
VTNVRVVNGITITKSLVEGK